MIRVLPITVMLLALCVLSACVSMPYHDTQIRRATIQRGREILDNLHFHYSEDRGLCFDKSTVATWIDFYEQGSRSKTEDGEKVTRLFCREFIMGVIYKSLNLSPAGICPSSSGEPFAYFEPDAAELLRQALKRWGKTKEQDLTPKQQKRCDTLLKAAGVE